MSGATRKRACNGEKMPKEKMIFSPSGAAEEPHERSRRAPNGRRRWVALRVTKGRAVRTTYANLRVCRVPAATDLTSVCSNGSGVGGRPVVSHCEHLGPAIKGRVVGARHCVPHVCGSLRSPDETILVHLSQADPHAPLKHARFPMSMRGLAPEMPGSSSRSCSSARRVWEERGH